MTLIVSTMSANLASLPLLHEHKVLTAPRTLMVCYRRANLASLLYYHAPQKSACAHATHESPLFCGTSKVITSRAPQVPYALALKGLAHNETTAQSRDCAVAKKRDTQK